MNDIFRRLPAVLAPALWTVAISAETLTVCASGCDYTSINAAIGAARDGDVIQLAAETYFEGEQIDTLGKAIMLRGVLDKAGEPASVLDGAGMHRVLICRSGESDTTVFENLRVQHGYGLPWSVPSDRGGGMYNVEASPTLLRCTFHGNLALDGGGLFNEGSSPILTDCAFTANSATSGLAPPGGGGMYNHLSSSPTLTGCAFTNNVADYGGGMNNQTFSSPALAGCTFAGNVAEYGGGMANLESGSPFLVDCEFSANSAKFAGGGMYNNTLDHSPTLSGCAFSENSSSSGGGVFNAFCRPSFVECEFNANAAFRGGGMFNMDLAGPSLEVCVFRNNSAAGDGGGMYAMGSYPTIADGVFDGNSAAGDGGGICLASSGEISFVDCRLERNSAGGRGGGLLSRGGALSLTLAECVFSQNQAELGGGGFCLDDSEDTTLVMEGCVFTECCQLLPIDLGGVPNQNDLGWPCVDCVGDVTCDGEVDGEDLGRLLTGWGTTLERFDLNGDGIVDPVDLAQLLVSWGPCR